jgi:hypothetical protein
VVVGPDDDPVLAAAEVQVAQLLDVRVDPALWMTTVARSRLTRDHGSALPVLAIAKARVSAGTHPESPPVALGSAGVSSEHNVVALALA